MRRPRADVLPDEIGADLRRQALMATAGASGGMLLYLAWRFRVVYGVAAVVAMAHDALITIGLFSLLNQEISLTVVAALLCVGVVSPLLGLAIERLARYLADARPVYTILAKPVPLWGRWIKWAKRKPAIAALTGAIVFLSILVLAGVLWQWREAEARARTLAALNDELAEAILQGADDFLPHPLDLNCLAATVPN